MKHLLFALLTSLLFLISCGKEQPKVESKIEVKPEQSITRHEEKTGTMMVADAKKNLQEAKAKLAQESKYDCCMEDACDYCAVHDGSCGCAHDVKKGEHICIECYAGWQQGKGDVPNVKKEDVKTDFVMHEHMHD